MYSSHPRVIIPDGDVKIWTQFNKKIDKEDVE